MSKESSRIGKEIRVGPREVHVPVDWQSVPLHEIIEESGSGEWGKESKSEDHQNRASVIRSGDISLSGDLSTDDIATRFLSDEDYEKCAIEPKDIVIVSSSGSERHIGKKWFAPETLKEKKYHFTNFLYRIRLDDSDVIPRYVYYFLCSSHETAFIKSISPTSTGLQNLDTDSYEDLTIPLPPISEQRRIVDILSTVDSQIQQTERITTEVKNLKRGITFDLFQNGISHTSFNTKSIGARDYEFPQSWELVAVEDILDDTTDKKPIRGGPPGGKISKEDRVEQGPKVYVQENIIHRDYSMGTEYLSEEKFEELEGASLEPGDVVITRAGTVGRTDVFPESARAGIMDSSLIRLKVDEERVRPEYLATYISDSSISKFQIESMSHGGTRTNINNQIIKELSVPLPPLSEQDEISEILGLAEQRHKEEQKTKQKLKELKDGLMQDLLTGNVRVSTD